MPLFALANAGVVIDARSVDPSTLRVITAVAVGLVLGKPLGVLLAVALTLRTGLGTLPLGLTYRHLTVLGVVAGVGFTMALFVAQLAFSDPQLLAAAKLGVLGASLVAAVLAVVLGRALLSPEHGQGQANTADQAESSTVQ
jgi:NhaA family Na+:H+ antiporter